MVNPTSANEIYTELQDAFSKAYPADSDQVLRRLAELIAPLYNGRVTYRRNVLDFGAVPDGVTDCQPAFLAARNSIPSGSAGEILVPRVEGAVNRYYLSASIAGQTDNFVRWVYDDGVITVNSPGSTTASMGRVSGNEYWRDSKTSQSRSIQVKSDRDTSNGNSVYEWLQVENNGPNSGNGRRYGYVSNGYGEDTFDIAQFTVARWERVAGAGRAGQQLAEWLVAISPTLPDLDNNRYGTFVAEWNTVNRGPDTGWSKRRSTLDQWTGFLQIVPEGSIFESPTGGTAGNITFGLVFTWGQGGDGGRGYVPRMYTPILGEPNSVHNTGRAIFWSGDDGSDTLPGSGPPVAVLEADDNWQWGVKTNGATFTQQPIGLGQDQAIGWLDGSDSLTGAIEQEASGAWGFGVNYSTRGVRNLALAFGRSSVDGDRQERKFHLRRNLSSPTNVRITTDGGAATGLNQVILANSSAVRIQGQAVARSGAGDAASWSFTALVKRGANAASTTVVSQTVTKDTSDAGASTWALAIVADTTNGGAGFEVTGTGSFNVMATLGVVETVG